MKIWVAKHVRLHEIPAGDNAMTCTKERITGIKKYIFCHDQDVVRVVLK